MSDNKDVWVAKYRHSSGLYKASVNVPPQKIGTGLYSLPRYATKELAEAAYIRRIKEHEEAFLYFIANMPKATVERFNKYGLHKALELREHAKKLLDDTSS